MAGNHPDAWDTASQWESPQWQDSTRWEWHADAWWQWGQWGHGSAWQQLDRPAIPALEEQKEKELSQPWTSNLSECASAPVSAIRRSAAVQAWEPRARSDPATREPRARSDPRDQIRPEQQVLNRVRSKGIPEHPIPYKAAPTGKESEAHHSGVQVEAAPAGVPFKAPPAGVPLIRWPCKAPPQRVKPPQPGVDQP